MKRIGMLTSGGDCQALNAAMRGVAKALLNSGEQVEIYGFQDGYQGLIYGRFRLLTYADFTGILTRAEYLELKEDYSGKVRTAVERVRELQAQQSELEALVKDCASLADKLAAAEKDKALTARLVEQVIERVTVSGPGDVAIQFRFEDSFLRLARSLHG